MANLTIEERERIARKRIRSILLTRTLASIKQLENKISESGPTDQRCDPHVISKVIKKMDDLTYIVGPFDTHFYVLEKQFSSQTKEQRARVEEVFRLYDEYRALASNMKFCGHALEHLIWNALAPCNSFVPIGGVGNHQKQFGKVILPGELDFVLTHKSNGYYVLGEAKNLREWIYPSSKELWEFILKLVFFHEARVPFVPVFVARKIHYSTRLLFRRIGVLGVDVHHQYFSPEVADRLTEIRHKDGLGFHDISTSTEHPSFLERFFTTTVQHQALDAHEQFVSSLPILSAHADGMAKAKYRQKAWFDVAHALGISHEYD